jgi:hypothetical protein
MDHKYQHQGQAHGCVAYLLAAPAQVQHPSSTQDVNLHIIGRHTRLDPSLNHFVKQLLSLLWLHNNSQPRDQDGVSFH